MTSDLLSTVVDSEGDIMLKPGLVKPSIEQADFISNLT